MQIKNGVVWKNEYHNIYNTYSVLKSDFIKCFVLGSSNTGAPNGKFWEKDLKQKNKAWIKLPAMCACNLQPDLLGSLGVVVRPNSALQWWVVPDSSPVVSKLSLLINYLLRKRLGYARGEDGKARGGKMSSLPSPFFLSVIPFVKEPVLVFHAKY